MPSFLNDRSMFQEQPIDSNKGLYRVMLDVPAARAAGCLGIIHRAGQGLYADPTFAEAVGRSIAASHPWGFYHVFLSDRPVADQIMLIMRQLAMVDAKTMTLNGWADVEEGSERGGANFYPRLLAYLEALDAVLHGVAGIYSRANYLDFYLSAQHQAALAHRPGWWANREIPLGWQGQARSWVLRQRVQPQKLPGFYNVVDVDDFNPDYPLMGVPMANAPLITVDGCLFGGFTQGNSSITPIYTDLARQGILPPVAITDEDGGKVSEWARLGVRVRVNRKHLPETGPDHEFEYGGDAGFRRTWPADKVLRYQTQAVNLPYKASYQEFVDTTHWHTLGNEWDGGDPAGDLSDLTLMQGVLLQSEQRSVHDKAVLMGISDAQAATLPPVRYCLPVYNAGTPHHWADYVAIAEHPIWPLAARRGDLLWVHEGINFDEPFTNGEGLPVDPGSSRAPGAGTQNFRIFNLLWLLAQKGIYLNWGVGEWYDGRRGRDNQLDERVANMIRHDLLLAASPFSRYCVGYCQYMFTNDPASRWYPQDCTRLWQHPMWLSHLLRQRGRKNGVTDMTEVPQDQLDKLYANTQAEAAAAQANLGILAAYQTHKHTLAGMTNQDVINLFAHAFANMDYGQKLVDAGLTGTYTPDSNRKLAYTGPAIEDMKLLLVDQQTLIAALPKQRS